jgi:hypothetical protein
VLIRVAVGLVLGVVTGALGTVAHRGHMPWGLVAALAFVLTTTTMLRAWAGRLAVVGQIAALAVTLMVLTREGPSGDMLVADDGPVGWVWLVGSVVIAALVAIAPEYWFTGASGQEPLAGGLPPLPGPPPGTATAGPGADLGTDGDDDPDAEEYALSTWGYGYLAEVPLLAEEAPADTADADTNRGADGDADDDPDNAGTDGGARTDDDPSTDDDGADDEADSASGGTDTGLTEPDGQNPPGSTDTLP